jgi:hypothetical protein
VLLVAGTDGAAMPAGVAPACPALVPVVATVFWLPAPVVVAVVCDALADCPTATELSAGATVPTVVAFVAVVPVTAAEAGADSLLPAASVVAAGGLLASLLADELADWPLGAEPAVVCAAGADSLVAAVEAVVSAVVGAAAVG